MRGLPLERHGWRMKWDPLSKDGTKGCGGSNAVSVCIAILQSLYALLPARSDEPFCLFAFVSLCLCFSVNWLL